MPGRWMDQGRRVALLTRYITGVLPRVDRELKGWRERLGRAGDPELAAQARASIDRKRFHCLGGSVYTLAGGGDAALVPFIVALQTISDYLDNLCDRTGCLEADAFRQLHTAFTGALDPAGGLGEYYARFPHRDDGGYLAALVERCRAALAELPSYPVVQRDVLWLASLYSDLQTFKHTHRHWREGLLRDWYAAHAGDFPGLEWWEFAAASGSTLGIFALCAAARQPGLTPEAARRLTTGYFPWICGLHILLDYFIDQEEDRQGGDLNLVAYYPDAATRRERLTLFLERALKAAAALPDPLFHTTVVTGLPALYLSDPKVVQQGLEGDAARLLAAGGPGGRRLYRLCRCLRRLGRV